MASTRRDWFRRPQAADLARRLARRRCYIQVVVGPRHVGKTSLVERVTDAAGVPVHFASADLPTVRGAEWIAREWEAARSAGRGAGAILVLDEVHKAANWAATVSGLWDEDSRAGRPLKVVVVASQAPEEADGIARLLKERAEVLRLSHWSFGEMRAAFEFSLKEYVYFGGYPGAGPLVRDWQRWRRFVLEGPVETTIARDLLLLTRVDKPALLRRFFELCCRHSGEVRSYTTMLGELEGAGNTTTLAHYLGLLSTAGLVTGIRKFVGGAARQRGPSPKLQVLNTALRSVHASPSFEEALRDPDQWGRCVEAAVGAQLANAAARGECELFHWRQGSLGVDFVVRVGRTVTAIEVASGRAREGGSGLARFARGFGVRRHLVVGGSGIPLERFLLAPLAALAAR